MKIRPLRADNHPKVSALLKQSFPGSNYEVRLFEQLHKNQRPMHEWVCIHTNRVIAYIAFSNAYHDNEICGLHIAPFAVMQQFQHLGVATELLSFTMRQQQIAEKSVFVVGKNKFYSKFGFKPCKSPRNPFTKNNKNFLSINHIATKDYTIGYEPEFKNQNL